MNYIDDLFLSISDILGSRVTPGNYRRRIIEINSARGITNKDKTEIIVEMLEAMVQMGKEIEDLKTNAGSNKKSSKQAK